MESPASFGSRFATFAAAHLPALEDTGLSTADTDSRFIQATLFDHGFAGVAFPSRYGGAGLTFEHQQALADIAHAYHMPNGLLVSVCMIAPAILDHAAERFCEVHLPRMLRGDEVWVQLLSEPGAGSDLAGVMTRALRDGDEWVINGSKIWSTGAATADYGFCLARTDFDQPKHKGLTVIGVPLDTDGLQIVPTVGLAGGDAEFFQEFLDDVRVPSAARIGDEGNGWRATQSLLLHERNAAGGVGHGLGYRVQHALGVDLVPSRDGPDLAAHRAGPSRRRHEFDRAVRSFVRDALAARVDAGLRRGSLRGNWGSVTKLALGSDAVPDAAGVMAVRGLGAIAWPEGETPSSSAISWLNARKVAIAGGTNEIQRNIIAERLLGMPREPGPAVTTPFREVLAAQQRVSAATHSPTEREESS
ncbi:MAG: acyl-CoA dehydrogenase family protein [Desertimonas sp.]